jgi:MoaA/NifB/PqqE/SkfB family radical SAM enzyme
MVESRIDLKIGFSCNNLCRFCVQGNKRHRFAPPPAGKLKKDLCEGRKTADGVVFTGGEPTLRKDLLDLVSHARELGYRTVQIQTNGRVFASKKACREAVAAGATEFSPALHGHTAALHDYLTRAPGSFGQTVAGIRNLKDLGQIVLSNSVVTRPNFRNLPELASLLVALGVDQFQLAFVHPVGTAGEFFYTIVPRMAMAAPFIMRALDVGLARSIPVCTEAVPYCMLPGHEACVVEDRIPRTRVIDAEAVIEDYRRYRLEEGKLKGPACGSCRRDGVCEGPWREYPEHYGFAEFVPIAKPQPRGGRPPSGRG